MGRHFGTEIRTWLPKPQAASIVLAASNSRRGERADDVCSANDPGIVINQAITELHNYGVGLGTGYGMGEIHLLEGIYDFTAATVPMLMRSGIKVKGAGWGTRIIPPPQGAFTGTIKSADETTTLSIVEISHMLFVGGGSGMHLVGLDESTIHHCWFYSQSTRAIYLEPGGSLQYPEEFDIHHCLINNPGYSGIRVDSPLVGFIIANNTLWVGGRWGNGMIEINNSVLPPGKPDMCQGVISGNSIQATWGHAIYLNNASLMLIDGNGFGEIGKGVANTYDCIHLAGISRYNNIQGNMGTGRQTWGGFGGGAFVTRYGVNISAATCTDNTVEGNKFDAMVSGVLNDVGIRTRAYRPRWWYFGDLLVNTANHIVVAQDLTAAPPIACVIAAQPDKPRNVTITITDADVSISAFQITVLGTNALGETESEVFVFAGGLVQTGNIAFQRITSVTVDSIVGDGVGDVLDVGIGSKLGLGDRLLLAGEITSVKKNNADWPPANYTVDTTYHTVDVSTGGVIVVGDDVIILHRVNANSA